MVLAGHPVVSVMRLAARPVGAVRAISPNRDNRWMMQLMLVVLPVPGPPVSSMICRSVLPEETGTTVAPSFSMP